VINKNFFDGGLQLGPRAFCEQTGRDKVFASQPAVMIDKACRGCPLCGADEPQRLFGVCRGFDPNLWDYSRCGVCGMIYTVFAPTPAELQKIYESAPAQQEWVRLQQNPLELELDRKKFQWALEKIGWPFGNRRILDIGCSTGTLLVTASEMAGWITGAGVEVNLDALAVAKERLRPPGAWRLVSDVSELGGALWDLVVLWEVLEHVLEPQAMLKKAYDLVIPGGYLLICVPNADALAVRILHEKCSVFGLGHLQLYSPMTLASAIARECPNARGLKQETIVSWSRELANWMAFKDPMGGNEPVNAMFTPEKIHEHLMGYKLVAWVRKGSA
jgi:2-polyprenyl-3-methyl-5-hydroxy-6-metoxy-1,4-benzoquinol methylase